MRRTCIAWCSAVVAPHSEKHPQSIGIDPAASRNADRSSPLPSSSLDPSFSKILEFPYQVVDSRAGLDTVADIVSRASTVAVDIEALVTHEPLSKQLGDISLLQLCPAGSPCVYLVDVLSLGKHVVKNSLKPAFTSGTVQKQFFDCRRDVEALSVQMGIVTEGALDLQLLFTGLQWKQRSINRRSTLSYVLKNVANISRPESDGAVQLAMTKGNRAVWDVRPLPSHFLEYAAGDVRHVRLLGAMLSQSHASFLDGATRLTAQYVSHYAGSGQPVHAELDPAPAEVRVQWLEMFFGPGGVCGYCKQKGHTETECFKKTSGVTKCAHCGETGHTANRCYKKNPQLRKCASCGQLGHTSDRCFKKNPCKHCGGHHASESCHRKKAASIATAESSSGSTPVQAVPHP